MVGVGLPKGQMRWVAFAVLPWCVHPTIISKQTVCEGAPCGPGNEVCGPPLSPAPVIHLQDESCRSNDPNGPMYFRGVHHLFYQRHVAREMNWRPADRPGNAPQSQQGPVWGHFASAPSRRPPPGVSFVRSFVRREHRDVGATLDGRVSLLG